MSKLKLALVSYINTIPFIEGIKSSELLKDSVELIIDYPSKCAALIKNKEVDGGLVPVGAMHEVAEYETITKYCIGANGAVETVALFSNQPLNEVKKIYLDYQSRTSVRLVKLLAENFWNQSFEYYQTIQGFESSIPEDAAILIIGDRVFKYQHLYQYKIDLAENWKNYTNLPFAFAVWVGNKKVKAIENELNIAFERSLSDIPNLHNDLLTIDKTTFVNYLTHSIDFNLDSGKKKAIKLFTSLLNSR